MPPALLASQLTILEPLEPDETGIVVDIAATPETIVDAVVCALETPITPQSAPVAPQNRQHALA